MKINLTFDFEIEKCSYDSFVFNGRFEDKNSLFKRNEKLIKSLIPEQLKMVNVVNFDIVKELNCHVSGDYSYFIQITGFIGGDMAAGLAV